MNKQKDTGYLFTKMEASDNGIGHIIVGDRRNSKAPNKKGSTFYFDESRTTKENVSFKKWITDNIMLLVTLSGVIIGVILGKLKLMIINKSI